MADLGPIAIPVGNAVLAADAAFDTVQMHRVWVSGWVVIPGIYVAVLLAAMSVAFGVSAVVGLSIPDTGHAIATNPGIGGAIADDLTHLGNTLAYANNNVRMYLPGINWLAQGVGSQLIDSYVSGNWLNLNEFSALGRLLSNVRDLDSVLFTFRSDLRSLGNQLGQGSPFWSSNPGLHANIEIVHQNVNLLHHHLGYLVEDIRILKLFIFSTMTELLRRIYIY